MKTSTTTTATGQAAAPFWIGVGSTGSDQLAAWTECGAAMFRGLQELGKVQADYWAQMAATTMEMQSRMLGAWNQSVDAGTVLESLSAIAGRPH